MYCIEYCYLKRALLLDVVFIALFMVRPNQNERNFYQIGSSNSFKQIIIIGQLFLSDKISITFHTRVNCFDLCIIILQSVIRKRCQISISRAIGFTS